MSTKCLWGCCVMAWVLSSVVYADELPAHVGALRAETDGYRAKIADTRKKIEHERKKLASDSASYAAYLKEYAARDERLLAERDSLAALAARLVRGRDSVAENEDEAVVRRESYVRQSAAILASLQAHCGELLDSLEPLGIFNIRKHISALRFLQGEIAAGTVGAAEGLERYRQIVAQLEQASQRIETWEGTSPVPALRGEVRFLRLGFVWLACAGGASPTAYLYDTHTMKWNPVAGDARVAAIDKAIKLSTGMAAPQLVALPAELRLRASGEAGGQ